VHMVMFMRPLQPRVFITVWHVGSWADRLIRLGSPLVWIVSRSLANLW